MRNIIIFLTISLFALGLVINEASAARFGGGRSFGYKRPMSSYSSTFNKSAPAATAASKASTNKWGGMLGGLLVGGLLASLFMGHGLASGLLSWLIVGAAVLFLINVYRRKTQPQYQSASASPFQQNPLNFSALSNFANSSTSTNTYAQDDFDSDAFTRAADVMLKERRRLVLMARESPLHLGHLKNMVQVTEMGGIIAPPVPAFYTQPTSIDDIVNHTVGRLLDLFDIDIGLVKRWGENHAE